MRMFLLATVLAGLFLNTGCTTLLSLHPAVTAADAVVNPALAGAWGTESGGDYFIVQAGEDKTYQITAVSDKSVWKFTGRLVRIEGAEILDLVAQGDEPFRVPAHFFVRVWPSANTLEWAFLDSDWVKAEAAKLATAPMENGVLVTVPTAAAGEFLKKAGPDRRACGKTQAMRRIR